MHLHWVGHKREVNNLNSWCYSAKRKYCHYTHWTGITLFRHVFTMFPHTYEVEVSKSSDKLDIILQCSMLTKAEARNILYFTQAVLEELSTHSGCWSCASPWRWRTWAPQRAVCFGPHNCDPWSWPCASSPDGCFRWRPYASWRASW